jgi:hypothetical protein
MLIIGDIELLTLEELSLKLKNKKKNEKKQRKKKSKMRE